MRTPVFAIILATAVLCLASFSFGSRSTTAGPPLAASGQITLPASQAWVDLVRGIPGELVAIHDLLEIGGAFTQLELVDINGNGQALTILDWTGRTHLQNGLIIRPGETLRAHTLYSADNSLFWSARLVR